MKHGDIEGRLGELLYELWEYGYGCDDVTINKTVTETSGGADRLDCLADALVRYFSKTLNPELTAALDKIFALAVQP